MKNIYYIVSITLVMITIGCTSIEDLQKNPNSPVEVYPRFLFTGIEISMFNNVNVSQNSFLAARYASNSSYVYDSQYYSWLRDSFSGYLNMKQVAKMEEAAEKFKEPIYKTLALFFYSYYIIDMTIIFGDVPYTEALKLKENILKPKYDTQESIFEKVLEDLKKASDQLANSPSSQKIEGDILFNGDKLKWRKFINSYTLRVLISLHKKTANDKLKVKERFNEIVNNPSKYPLFESNEDSAALPFYDRPGNRYPLFNNGEMNASYFLEKSFVDRLKNLKDHRLFSFGQKTENAKKQEAKEAEEAEKKGIEYKKKESDFTAYEGLLGSAPMEDNTKKASDGNASKFKERYYEDPVNEPSILMSYSEKEFILAEATQRGWITSNMDTHYKNAIRASMEFYKIETDTINKYLVSAVVQLQKGKELEMIMTQKHISMFANTGWQSFYEQRRTGFPEFNIDGGGLKVKKMPKRWMYPQSEVISNFDNLDEAIKRQYPDGDDIYGEMWLLK